MSTSAAASRPRTGRIDVHEPGDYPIILGESFKDKSSSQPQYLQIRYNWEPQEGLDKLKGNLRPSKDGIRLTYEDEESPETSYSYAGFASSKSKEENISQVVLVFDESKSAFVLEKLSNSYDVNLVAAHDQSKSETQKLPQLPKFLVDKDTVKTNGDDPPQDEDEGTADPSNPYDFRHFLAEARENVEKSQAMGNRTPIPGSRTPMSNIASPSLGPGRFQNNTPLFRPTPNSNPLPRKDAKPTAKAAPAAARKAGPGKRKEPTTKTSSSSKSTSKTISKERISNSDEEASETVTAPAPRSKHDRNISTSSLARSPHIVVSDGDLEIDLGSPPQMAPQRKTKLDPEAFRSQTHTPLGNRSAPQKMRDIEMMDPDRDDFDGDDRRRQHRRDDSDVDVDILNIGSPQSKKNTRRPSLAGEDDDDEQQAPSPPSPKAAPANDEDEDALLLQELMFNADEEEDGGDTVMGGTVDDDESEVSEEE